MSTAMEYVTSRSVVTLLFVPFLAQDTYRVIMFIVICCRPPARPSHGWIGQKTVEARIMQLSPHSISHHSSFCGISFIQKF